MIADLCDGAGVMDQRRTGDPGKEPTYGHERLANSPAGLMNIMTMKKAKDST